MDSALKQDAIVTEVTQGTTPATPAFKVLRTINMTGDPVRASTRSPERRADRRAANMVTGLNRYEKAAVMPFVRDAGADILWQSLLNGSFSTNVLKDGSTASFFTLEEKYSAPTVPYRRTTGVQVASLALSWRLGDVGQMSWAFMGLGETNSTSAISGATYAAASPGYDPVSTVDIAVSSLFGLTTPKVTGLTMNINNNMQPLYKFGSADPWALSLGAFDVSGQIECYLTAAADYTAFVTRATGQTFDLVFGSQSGSKDQITMGAVDVYNPQISDPGPSGQHMVTLPYMAKYYSGDTSAFKLTRNVA
ncbi:MAG: phage tail tube protein [Reyranellaceae bacterium]